MNPVYTFELKCVDPNGVEFDWTYRSAAYSREQAFSWAEEDMKPSTITEVVGCKIEYPDNRD